MLYFRQLLSPLKPSPIINLSTLELSFFHSHFRRSGNMKNSRKTDLTWRSKPFFCWWPFTYDALDNLYRPWEEYFAFLFSQERNSSQSRAKKRWFKIFRYLSSGEKHDGDTHGDPKSAYSDFHAIQARILTLVVNTVEGTLGERLTIKAKV